MPTSTASVADIKSSGPAAGSANSTAASAAPSGAVAVTTAGAAAGKGSAAPVDFLAMLEQMLQGPVTEAGELAVEALDSTSDGDSPPDGATADELSDPVLLGDPVLAIAALSLPAAPADVAAGAHGDDAAAMDAGRRGTAIALLGDATLADADASNLDAQVEALAKSDAANAGALVTVVSSSVQQSAAQGGQLMTQLVTQNLAPDFPAIDAAPAQVTQRVVHSSVGSNAWANELGTQLTLMAGQGQHSASLRLSPEHLGPLEVHIDMNDDKASVWFSAQHADTRAALNEALPRLRELFAASGMLLTDAGVSQQQPRQEARDNAARLAQALNRDSSQASLGATQTVTSVTSTSLLDLYA